MPEEGHRDTLDAVFENVLIENTAQTVFKRLNDIEHKRLTIQSRWIWELVQNARDASFGGDALCLQIHVETNKLTFRHNGMPFKDKEIAHLILHGTTKHDNGGVGRFGTGFITTHLISRRIRVRGALVGGRCFDFVLSREGTSPDEVRDAMAASRNEFKESLDRRAVAVDAPFTTEFQYPLDGATQDVVKSGIEALRACIPYLFAFNSVLGSISVVDDGGEMVWTKCPAPPFIEGTSCIRITRSPSNEHLFVTVCDSSDVQVALVTEGDPATISLPTMVPKLFVAFPLSGTETISVPLVANSESFEPLEERNGIHLGTATDEANVRNMRLFSHACDQMVTLAGIASSQHWHGICGIPRLNPPEVRDWIKNDWFTTQIQERLITPLRATPLVLTPAGDLVRPSEAWLPINVGKATAMSVWNMCIGLRAAASKLPTRDEVDTWDANIQSWSAFLKQSADSLPEAWTAHKLAISISQLQTMDGLRDALVEGTDSFYWINNLYSLLISVGAIGRLRELPLIPNQRGEFRNAAQLVLDSGIDEVLKDIAEALDVEIRSELMDSEVTLPAVRELMRLRTQGEVLSDVLNAVRRKMDAGDWDVNDEQANVRLFKWIMEHRLPDYLDGFPAVTRENEDGTAGVIQLKKNTTSQERPLAPVAAWPKPAQEFAELFPETVILSDKYCSDATVAGYWGELQDKGFLHVCPLFETDSYVDTFLPDEAMLEEAKTTSLRSETAVTRSEIAFLSGVKNVIDRVRSSQSRGVKLVRFLLEYILPSDDHAMDIEETMCEDGERHRYYHARWLDTLKKRPWIAVEKGKRMQASAESLASLLLDNEEVLKRLSEDRPARMFAAIGASPAEILLRSIGRDDPERIALIQSLAIISGAAGGDVAKVGALADAIAGDPRLFQFIEEKKERLSRVARNQMLGAMVEQRIRDVLSKVEGIKVVRTGMGHDFRLDPTLGEEEDAARIEISFAASSCFIEVKAASDDAVRMSVRQVEAAVAGPDRYVLCVVPVSGIDPSYEQVREQVRFVVDIGTRVAHLWSEYEELQDAMNDIQKTDGSLAMEMTDQGTRFRIGQDVWQAGLGFDDGVAHFKQLLGG